MIKIAFDQTSFDEMDRVEDMLKKYFKPGSMVNFNDVEIPDVKEIDFDTCSRSEIDGKTGERRPVIEVFVECNSGEVVSGIIWADYDLQIQFSEDTLFLNAVKKAA